MMNMKNSCTIVDIADEEITVKIGDIFITGFSNSGVLKTIGDEATVDVSLYDDLEICKSDKIEPLIIRQGNSFAYSLYGILDIENLLLKSGVDFEIDARELFGYGYLDGERVKIDVIRIDFDFE